MRFSQKNLIPLYKKTKLSSTASIIGNEDIVKSTQNVTQSELNNIVVKVRISDTETYTIVSSKCIREIKQKRETLVLNKEEKIGCLLEVQKDRFDGFHFVPPQEKNDLSDYMLLLLGQMKPSIITGKFFDYTIRKNITCLSEKKSEENNTWCRDEYWDKTCLVDLRKVHQQDEVMADCIHLLKMPT